MQHSQLLREARWAVWLTFVYLIGWGIFAYFTPSGRGLFGFPLWFELSCILLPLAFTCMVYVTIKKIYQDIDLDGAQDE